ncbi:MAG: 2-phosphosulfolactate phosphatase [Candidatus Bathyarchaeota archaeon BA1]|nr:MAG: 2-phosphosulfolactate phosphatase [Candidatus Bathyarchaeota archaeon BA1]
MRDAVLATLINLEFTAKDAVKAVQRRDVIIVIDVIRCCSTIITALANGAKSVIPTKNVREARMLHKEHPEFVLAGERGGLKPRGFDLGNSPREFSSNVIGGRNIILTTTSGTKAIIGSKNARWVLIGALLNAEATAKTALKIAAKEKTGISLVLSGRGGHFSLEDFLCAGAITETLPIDKAEHSDATLTALLAFQQARESLTKVIQEGYHAQYLKRMGFEEDVELCSKMNILGIVPFLKGERIVPLVP